MHCIVGYPNLLFSLLFSAEKKAGVQINTHYSPVVSVVIVVLVVVEKGVPFGIQKDTL